MRRATAILTVCLCAATGCRGGAAQQPYDGVIVAVQRSAERAVSPAPQVAEPQPMASEVDAPWSIALLSNAKMAAAKRPSKEIVVEAEPAVAAPIAHEVDLQLAIDPALVPVLTEEKRAAPKTCNGVVIRRS